MRTTQAVVLAVLIFSAASLVVPGAGRAGYWTTQCDRWGCQRVYVPTCHRRVVGYNPWGRPVFREVCH